MDWYAMVLIAAVGVALSSENVRLGIAYGTSKMQIPLPFSSILALTSLCTCLIGGLAAKGIRHVVAPSTCTLMGVGILLAMGLWIGIEPRVTNRDPAHSPDPRNIHFSEMMFIGVAQAMACVMAGIGTGFIHLNVIYTSLAVGSCSFLLLHVPCYMSSRFTFIKLNAKNR